MVTPLVPQEIYLLERYSSLEYFGQLRDYFAAMLKAAEDALAEFMKHLPPDYRSQPLHMQPDAVWGERVLPNLRWTLDGLNTGYIRLTHGDCDALGLAGNVKTAFAAINRDYSCDWMPAPYFKVADQNNSEAWERASNISITALGNWRPGSLGIRHTDRDRGPLDPPSSWPIYRLNPQIQVKTDAKVSRNGVYLPSTSASAAQFLIEGYEAWGANVPDDPSHPEGGFTAVPTTWTLVERIADSGGGTPRDPDLIKAGMRLRCEAGQPCPREGYWFTPARENSHRRFSSGELMPEVGGDYGTTIWQWDETQG